LPKSSSKISKIQNTKFKLTWLACNTNPWRDFISERSRHRKTWYVLIFEPNSKWADRLLVLISETVNASPALQNPCRLICLAWLLVPAYGLGLDLITDDLADYGSWVTHIDAEQFLAQSHYADTSASRKSYVQIWIEQLLVTIQKSIVECNAAFIGVKHRILLSLLKFFVIFCENVAQIRLDVLLETRLH